MILVHLEEILYKSLNSTFNDSKGGGNCYKKETRGPLWRRGAVCKYYGLLVHSTCMPRKRGKRGTECLNTSFLQFPLPTLL